MREILRLWLVAKRLYMPAFAALAGAALVGLLVYGLSTQAATRTLDEQLSEGRHPVAPQATRRLPWLDANGSGSLSAYRGKVVLLNFWASWCEPCQAEAPRLERIQRELTAHGGTVLGVTYLDASPDSQGFVRRFKLTYPSLRDTSGDFAHSYGTDQLPESFIIDRAGRVVGISRGEVADNDAGRAFLAHAISLAEGT